MPIITDADLTPLYDSNTSIEVYYSKVWEISIRGIVSNIQGRTPGLALARPKMKEYYKMEFVTNPAESSLLESGAVTTELRNLQVHGLTKCAGVIIADERAVTLYVETNNIVQYSGLRLIVAEAPKNTKFPEAFVKKHRLLRDRSVGEIFKTMPTWDGASDAIKKSHYWLELAHVDVSVIRGGDRLIQYADPASSQISFRTREWIQEYEQRRRLEDQHRGVRYSTPQHDGWAGGNGGLSRSWQITDSSESERNHIHPLITGADHQTNQLAPGLQLPQLRPAAPAQPRREERPAGLGAGPVIDESLIESLTEQVDALGVKVDGILTRQRQLQDSVASFSIYQDNSRSQLMEVTSKIEDNAEKMDITLEILGRVQQDRRDSVNQLAENTRISCNIIKENLETQIRAGFEEILRQNREIVTKHDQLLRMIKSVTQWRTPMGVLTPTTANTRRAGGSQGLPGVENEEVVAEDPLVSNRIRRQNEENEATERAEEARMSIDETRKDETMRTATAGSEDTTLNGARVLNGAASNGAATSAASPHSQEKDLAANTQIQELIEKQNQAHLEANNSSNLNYSIPAWRQNFPPAFLAIPKQNLKPGLRVYVIDKDGKFVPGRLIKVDTTTAFIMMINSKGEDLAEEPFPTKCLLSRDLKPEEEKDPEFKAWLLKENRQEWDILEGRKRMKQLNKNRNISVDQLDAEADLDTGAVSFNLSDLSTEQVKTRSQNRALLEHQLQTRSMRLAEAGQNGLGAIFLFYRELTLTTVLKNIITKLGHVDLTEQVDRLLADNNARRKKIERHFSAQELRGFGQEVNSQLANHRLLQWEKSLTQANKSVRR